MEDGRDWFDSGGSGDNLPPLKRARMGMFGHGMGDETAHDALRKAGESLREAAKTFESVARVDDHGVDYVAKGVAKRTDGAALMSRFKEFDLSGYGRTFDEVVDYEELTRARIAVRNAQDREALAILAYQQGARKLVDARLWHELNGMERDAWRNHFNNLFDKARADRDANRGQSCTLQSGTRSESYMAFVNAATSLAWMKNEEVDAICDDLHALLPNGHR